MSKVAGGSVAPNKKNPLMEQEALFSGKVHLVVEDIFNIPSPHMTLERMFQLKERIQKLILNQLMAWLLRMEQIH